MPPLSASIIERLLDRVRRPSRYIGGEFHLVRKDPATLGVRICLAFPEVYEIGMSHLGLRILYDVLNRDAAVYAERAFCPWPDLEKLMREENVPLWSLETRTPLSEFDLVGFSLQSEMIGTNVLTMLDLAGIPLLAADRDNSHPLIIGGGPVAFNPEPFADFFDCFIIGDGETALPEFLRAFRTLELHRPTASGGAPCRTNRRDILHRLCTGDGVYVPSLYQTETDTNTGFTIIRDTGDAPCPVRRALVDDLTGHPFPTQVLVPQGDIVHDRYAMEIARGCTEGCRFCQAGIIYRPQRERPPREIINSLAAGIDCTGYDEASLTALSTADYTGIEQLARAAMTVLAPRHAAMSVSSLRAYGITKDLAAGIAGVRKTGFTIAPEAGTQRLRNVINKGITDEDITTAAQIAFNAGWKLLKLYFMIGLPTETDEDVAAIAATAIRVLKLSAGAKGRARAKINVAVASFVPKPHSPFAWAAFDNPENLKRKQNLLRSLLNRHKNIQIKFHNVEQSTLEAVLARGDRRLGRVLHAAWIGGARFDEWTEHFRMPIWEKAFASCNIAPAQYLAEFPLEARLPWDHIDPGVDREFLRREYQRGLAGKCTHPCEKPPAGTGADGKLVCYSCGLACDLEAIAGRRADGARQLQKLTPPVAQHFLSRAMGGGNHSLRYRLCYGKTGWSRYLSHLEVVRLWQRAFRRAGIILQHSAGFHPHPRLSFGPALPVGVEGLSEYLDCHTVEYAVPEHMRRALTNALPDTFPLHDLREISRHTPGIEKLIDLHLYEISGPVSSGGLVSLINEKIAAETWIITRKKEQTMRKLDARPYIISVEEKLADGYSRVELKLKSIAGGTVKPGELLEALYGEIPAGTRIVRVGLGREIAGKFVTPLDEACLTVNG
jgi:radical SAM family uncharacterized protein/radical SAM-linked protein